MTKKLKKRLLLEKRSDYIRHYLDMANYRAGICMSLVVIALLIFVLISLTVHLRTGGAVMSVGWLIGHYTNCVLLLLVASLVLMHCLRRIKGRAFSWFQRSILLFLFSVYCLGFGIYISLVDYGNGDAVLRFMAMEVLAVCLLSWHPIQSFVMLAVSFGIFYGCLSSGMRVPYVTRLNLFLLFVVVFATSVSNYIQHFSEAKSAESLREANARMQRLAVCDELTGIANFPYFKAHVPEILAMEKDHLGDFSVLFLDIENFKSYNEKHGFEKGDVLLKKVSAKLVELFERELVARFSDDHFVILTKRDNVPELVDIWSERLHEAHPMSGLLLKCGAYHPTDAAIDPRQACDYARYACALTKRRYDLNYKLYDEKMDEEFRLRRYVVNNIDKAVAKGYIKAYYQPVVWADTHKLCGVEALARWIDPTYGFLSPGIFVPVLEEYRQVHKLDVCIMRQVCRDIRYLQDQKIATVPASINFSRLDFELTDICSLLEQSVEEFRVPKEYLHVEVTESALLDKDGLLKNAMKRLQDEDFQVWLDDFGSGYSSLNVLKDYNFDVMKIDMQFLENFGANEKTKEILKSIVDMADVLPMGTLTEGVETEEEAEFLTSIGCKRLQGYHFGKPMPLDEIIKQIEDGKLLVSEEFLQ